MNQIRLLVMIGASLMIAQGCTIEEIDEGSGDDALIGGGPGDAPDIGPGADPDVAPPVASFSVATDPRYAFSPVEFVNTSTNATSYLWDFGDGRQAVGREEGVTHAYDEAGTYTVTLCAEGPGGRDETSLTVEVLGPRTFADFSVNAPDPIIAGRTMVTFVSNSNFADDYLWDFGDGTTSTEASPTHVFQSVGDHVVSLTVSNASGEDTATRVVTAFLDPATGIFLTEVVINDMPFALSAESPFVLPPTGTDIADGQMDIFLFAGPAAYFREQLPTASIVDDLYTYRSVLPRVVRDEDDFPKIISNFQDVQTGMLLNEAIPMEFGQWMIHTWESDDEHGFNLLHQVATDDDDPPRTFNPFIDFVDVDDTGHGEYVTTTNVDHADDTGTEIIIRYRHGAR